MINIGDSVVIKDKLFYSGNPNSFGIVVRIVGTIADVRLACDSFILRELKELEKI